MLSEAEGWAGDDGVGSKEKNRKCESMPLGNTFLGTAGKSSSGFEDHKLYPH